MANKKGEGDVVKDTIEVNPIGDMEDDFQKAHAAGAELEKVIKLKDGKSVRGEFLGYRPVEVADPKSGEVKTLDHVGIKHESGLVVLILGTAQIMASLSRAQPGDIVTIAKTHEPDAETRRGFRVKQFLIAVEKAPQNKLSAGPAFSARPNTGPLAQKALPAAERTVDGAAAAQQQLAQAPVQAAKA